MSVFADRSDANVRNIITYVRTEYKKMQAAAPAAGAPGAAVAAESGPSNLVIFGLIGVIVIAFIVILVLNKVIGTLERLLLKRQGLPVEEEVVEAGAPVDRLALVRKLAKNKKFVFFVILCGTIAMG